MQVAIDTAVILCQGNAIVRHKYRRKKSLNVGISVLFYRAIHFIEHGIDPIFVLEGTNVPRDHKRMESMMIADRILSLMGIPVVHATGEGEATGAHIVKMGDADAFATPNIVDAFFFGSPVCIKSNLHANLMDEPKITLNEFLVEQGFRTIDEYRDFFILIGSDYNDKLLPTGMGKKRAQRLINQYGSIENIPDIPIDIGIVERVREIGRKPAVTTNYIIEFSEPRYNELFEVLTTVCGFSENRATNGIERIKAQHLRNYLKKRRNKK